MARILSYNSKFFSSSFSESFRPSHFPWISFSLKGLVTFCTAEAKDLTGNVEVRKA
jgi:hypothetical protein